MGYDRIYFLKKAFAVYPGVREPRSAPVFAAHYARRRRDRSPARAVLDALVGLGFLAWTPVRAAQVAMKYDLDAAWSRRATRIAWDRFMDPNDIALFGIDSVEDAVGYIRRFEDAALNKRINPLGWSGACALADKLRFEARLGDAGLPRPEVIAQIRSGRMSLVAEPAGRDVVAKPSHGEGGDGIRVLPAVADAADLAQRLGPVVGDWIVQARAMGHAGLADVSLNALATVRVVTILAEDGAPEVVSATLRLASRSDAVVDNMKAGGLIIAVALDDGVLGPAWQGYGGGPFARHPTTGAPIEGRRVPDWDGAKALARRAHAEAFPDYALVGWDIAPTESGPWLIEGNAKPGVLMPQRAARRGLAQGRYGQLLAHHLSVAR